LDKSLSFLCSNRSAQGCLHPLRNASARRDRQSSVSLTVFIVKLLPMTTSLPLLCPRAFFFLAVRRAALRHITAAINPIDYLQKGELKK